MGLTRRTFLKSNLSLLSLSIIPFVKPFTANCETIDNKHKHSIYTSLEEIRHDMNAYIEYLEKQGHTVNIYPNVFPHCSYIPSENLIGFFIWPSGGVAKLFSIYHSCIKTEEEEWRRSLSTRYPKLYNVLKKGEKL